MDSEYVFDVTKIIEAGLNGDVTAVQAYAEQFVAHLRSQGDSSAAKTIASCLKPSRAKKVALARGLSEFPPIPVDSESRMPLADVELPDLEKAHLFLPESIRAEVGRFFDFFRAAPQLIENGVGISPSMLVHGPPGCGKTQLARFIAAELHLPLIVARTDGLISSFLGSTAKNIRLLFEHVASRPCIFFLDEFDALAKMRDDDRELGELKRVVISLLQNIDALGHERVLLAATNHEHLLDPAIWRRFSFRVQLAEPDYETRLSMLAWFFRDYANDLLIEAVAAIGDGLTGAELRLIAENAIREAIIAGESQVSISSAISATVHVSQKIEAGSELPIDKCARMLREANPRLFTQEKIANIFNVSQPKICRLLKTG